MPLSSEQAAGRDFALNPFPSDLCTSPTPLTGPQSIHLCFTRAEQERTIDLFRDRAGGLVGVAGPQTYAETNAQPRWGFGMMLAAYLNDWGDRIRQLDRSNAHITILRSFPDSWDRRLALTHLDRFTWRNDPCTTAFEAFLIGHPEHVGYHWVPSLLKQWFRAAAEPPQCGDPFTALDRTAAISQARAWLERTLPLWRQLTDERYPYDLKNIAGFWDPTYDDAPLPRESPAQPAR